MSDTTATTSPATVDRHLRAVEAAARAALAAAPPELRSAIERDLLGRAANAILDEVNGYRSRFARVAMADAIDAVRDVDVADLKAAADQPDRPVQYRSDGA